MLIREHQHAEQPPCILGAQRPPLRNGFPQIPPVFAERQPGEGIPDKRNQIHPSINVRFRRIPDGTFLIHVSLLCGGTRINEKRKPEGLRF